MGSLQGHVIVLGVVDVITHYVKAMQSENMTLALTPNKPRICPEASAGVITSNPATNSASLAGVFVR